MVLVYPGDTRSDCVGIAEILVLAVDPDIGERIGACADHPHRNDLRREPEDADFPCILSPNRLSRDPPVGCDAVDRALACRVDSEGLLRIGTQWPITAKLQIEHVVEEAIATEADDLLRVDLVDERRRGRHRCQLGAYVWKAPGRNRVPDILNRRVVVDGRSPEQSVAVDVNLLSDAYVRIVPGKAVADAVPRSLNEGAEIVGDLAAGKEARLLQDKIVVDTKSRCCAARLSRLSIRKGRLQHDCERRAFPISAPQGIAAEFEPPAEWRQLQESRMAGRACLTGLARVERERDGMPRGQRRDGSHPDDENAKRQLAKAKV